MSGNICFGSSVQSTVVGELGLTSLQQEGHGLRTVSSYRQEKAGDWSYDPWIGSPMLSTTLPPLLGSTGNILMCLVKVLERPISPYNQGKIAVVKKF